MTLRVADQTSQRPTKNDGPERTWRLANFISHRRTWTAELETALGLVVQLELANRQDTPEAGYVELW